MSVRHDAGTAGRAGIRASTATGYRMPPLHARPALGDCLAVYRHALAEGPPGKIIAGGVPAGGPQCPWPGPLSGVYWSATTGGHVIYESRLELARLLLADFDSVVTAIGPAVPAACAGGRSDPP
jgi:hypothetical protein